LGVSEPDFWALTPRQLNALTKRWRARWDAERYLFGMLASVTANFSFCHPKEPYSPADFMPGYKRDSERELPADDNSIARKIHSILAPRSIPKR
jgi:hypothetical protein